MKINQFVVMVMSIMSVLWVSAGKMEEFGGFKARDYKKGADGKLYTSAGTEVKNFIEDLTPTEQSEYIEAARMASSGYPDHRNDEFKNTSYRDGEYSKSQLEAIVKEAEKLSPDSGFKVFEQPIRKYDDASGKWVDSGERIYTITGKDATRLCVRVFEKTDANGVKTIGVVYGGTDWGTTGVTAKLWLDDAADARDDAKQITHFAPTPQAYKDAATILQAIVKLNQNTDINVYGHSEGGGEAMYSVLTTGVKNGKDEKTGKEYAIKYYGVNSAGLNGLKTNDIINENLNKKDIANNFTLIQNCENPTTLNMLTKEWCSTKAYQFGTVISIPDMGDVFGVDKDGKIGDNTFLMNGKNEDEELRGKEVEKSWFSNKTYSVEETNEKVDVMKNLDNKHGVEETLWKMTHFPSAKQDEKNESGQVGKNEDDPFDSEPEPKDNGQVHPSPGNGGVSSGGKVAPKPAPNTRVRRGGGGDTSSRIL